MSKADEPAFPSMTNKRLQTGVPVMLGGLSKREMFAALAMVSLGNSLLDYHYNDLAKSAVSAADALLAELAKPSTEGE